MSDENIHKGHRKRMREKVRKNGLDSLQEHEILEYILYYSIPRINTNEIAHKLIKKCNGFANVFKAPDEVLRSVDKVGENTISHLHMLDEFARYYTKAMSGAHRLKLNGKNCEEYLMNLFNGETRELFYMICLDAKAA
ncbi:MAG: hypothetical protein J1F01_03145 [Oscillospiraceae bacterium]|nr:hypothetical protein [Oscillospiraceae bacterium]